MSLRVSTSRLSANVNIRRGCLIFDENNPFITLVRNLLALVLGQASHVVQCSTRLCWDIVTKVPAVDFFEQAFSPLFSAMVFPLLFRLVGGVDGLDVVLGHVLDAIHTPFALSLYPDRSSDKGGQGLGPVNGKHVWEALDGHGRVGEHSLGELDLDTQPIDAADVDLCQPTRDRIGFGGITTTSHPMHLAIFWTVVRAVIIIVNLNLPAGLVFIPMCCRDPRIPDDIGVKTPDSNHMLEIPSRKARPRVRAAKASGGGSGGPPTSEKIAARP